jgi:hypothetical protein
MRILSTIAIMLMVNVLLAQESKTSYNFKRISTSYGDIELPNKGKIQVNCLVADFNNNKTNDFIIVEKTENQSVTIFTKTDENKWERNIIERRSIPAAESGTVFDINGNGNLDLVVGSAETDEIWWWENPYPNDSRRGWRRNYVKRNGPVGHGDMAFGDFNGDGKAELAFWSIEDRSLYVANMPEGDVSSTDNWPLTKIYTYGNQGQMMQRSNGTELPNAGVNHHEGIAVTDINSDGIDNIIAGGMWFSFENGTYIPNYIDMAYSSARIAAGHLIEGGSPEIVMVSGKGHGPLVMYQLIDKVWTPKILDNTTRRANTLQLIDFDKNGKLDIFVAEMNAQNVTNPRIFVMLNRGDGNFQNLEISKGIGSHNTGIGDISGNGHYDIIGKPYDWNTPRLDIWINSGPK